MDERTESLDNVLGKGEHEQGTLVGGNYVILIYITPR